MVIEERFRFRMLSYIARQIESALTPHAVAPRKQLGGSALCVFFNGELLSVISNEITPAHVHTIKAAVATHQGLQLPQRA